MWHNPQRPKGHSSYAAAYNRAEGGAHNSTHTPVLDPSARHDASRTSLHGEQLVCVALDHPEVLHPLRDGLCIECLDSALVSSKAIATASVVRPLFEVESNASPHSLVPQLVGVQTVASFVQVAAGRIALGSPGLTTEQGEAHIAAFDLGVELPVMQEADYVPLHFGQCLINGLSLGSCSAANAITTPHTGSRASTCSTFGFLCG